MTTKNLQVIKKIVENTLPFGEAKWITKNMVDAIETSAGWIIEFKKEIKKEFGFYYSEDDDKDEEDAKKNATNAMHNVKFFLKENLEDYDNIIKLLENNKAFYISTYKEHPNVPLVFIIDDEDMQTLNKNNSQRLRGAFNDNDIKNLIKFYKKLRKNHEKTCKAYIEILGKESIYAYTWHN